MRGFLLLPFLLVSSLSLSPKDTIDSYATSMGYPVESNHYATTEDGYILNLWRFPRVGAPVVYLQHGILASSWCWLVNDPDRSIGFVLYKMGYDVWFGNSRGNTYSRNHTTLSINSNEFWNYTFTQMAMHDLPTQVDYILEHSGASDLTYVGWSQGMTQLFIAGSLGTVDKSKINIAIGVSPVSYLKFASSLLLKSVSALHLGDVIYAVYKKGFLDGSVPLSELEQFFCRITLGAVCQLTIDVICGRSKLDDSAALVNLTAHFPAGTSTKDLLHYSQWMNENVFQDYDYGKRKNEQIYGQKDAPAFNLSNFDLPVALLGGTHDDLVSLTDLSHLEKELPHENIKFSQTYNDFSHVTWLVGEEKAWYFFQDLGQLILEYNPLR